MTTASYTESLQTIPPPGAGCHPALLGVANLGVRDGLDGDRIFRDIRAAIPSGRREVPDREIRDAVDKAVRERDRYIVGRHDHQTSPAARREFAQRKQQEEADRQRVEQIVRTIKPADPAGLRERSPVRPTDDPRQDAQLLLSTLFTPRDLVWVGDAFETHRPASAAAWGDYWGNGTRLPPFVIINPLTGEQAETKSGNLSYRCDAAVAAHHYALVEFDDLTIEQQAGRVLWMLDRKTPIAAVVHSGGKSLHAWVRVDVADAAAWQRDIHGYLFPRYLIPLGADRACRNPARLSRLPGAIRDNGNVQRLFFLSHYAKDCK